MILWGGRGLLAVVALVAMVAAAAAQQPVQPQNGMAPQNSGAPILGRPRPTVGPAAPRPPEPRATVSVVSPGQSNVFGRKTKVGGETRGMTDGQRVSGMGQ